MKDWKIKKNEKEEITIWKKGLGGLILKPNSDDATISVMWEYFNDKISSDIKL